MTADELSSRLAENPFLEDLATCGNCSGTGLVDPAMDSRQEALEYIEICEAKLKSLEVELSITRYAADNGNRRLSDANERIVEFETLKAAHRAAGRNYEERIAELESIALHGAHQIHQLLNQMQVLEAEIQHFKDQAAKNEKS
jgi:hypothetical protein